MADADRPRRVSRPAWLEHLTAGVLIVGLVAGFFWPALFGGKTFTTIERHQDGIYPWTDPDRYEPIVQSDEADLSYPAQVLLTESLAEGTLPFWDPHSYGGGVPHYTDGSNPVAYPPRLLLARFVDPVRAHLWFTAGHLLVAGLATYALGRRLRFGMFGAMAMTTAWMFAGFNMAFLHLDQISPVTAMIPLSLLVVDWSVRRATWATAGAGGLALGFALLGGHLLFMALAVGPALVYGFGLAVADAMARPASLGSRRFVAVARMALTAAVAAGAAAVVLLPTVVALDGSARRPVDRDAVAGQLVAPSTMLEVFATPPGDLDAVSVNAQPFVGALAAGLAVVGLVARRRGAALGRGLAIGAFFAATTTLGARLFFRIPTMDAFRPLGRLSVLFAFGLVVLAGVGGAQLAEVARHWHRRVVRRQLLAAAAAAVALVAGTAQVFAHGHDVNPDFASTPTEGLFPAVPLIGAVVGEASTEGIPALLANIRRREPGEEFFTSPVLYGAEGVVFGLESTSGYRSSLPRRTADLLRVLEGEDVEDVLENGLDGAYITDLYSGTTRLDLLPRLGVQLVVTAPTLPPDLSWTNEWLAGLDLKLEFSDDTGSVYRIGVPTGARLVDDLVVVDDDADALRTFTAEAHRLTDGAVITPDQVDRLDGFQPRTGTTGDVTLARPGPNRLDATVAASGPAMLVLPVNWDPGWSATVDGRSVPVLRVDYGRVGIAVDDTTAAVALAFRPPGLQLGAAVSTATVVFVLELWLWAPLRRLTRSGRSRRPRPT